MATATVTVPATVAGELLDQVVPVSDLLAKVPQKELAKAWLTGDVEFGRREYVVTGKPGTKSEAVGSVLILESAVCWTGPKRVKHKPLKELLAESEQVPECGEYRTYEPDGSGGVKPVPVSRADAAKALALMVRLTDKGLAALQE